MLRKVPTANYFEIDFNYEIYFLLSFTLLPNLEEVPARNVATFVTLSTCSSSFSSPEVASTALSLSYSRISSFDFSTSSYPSFDSSSTDYSFVFVPWLEEIGVSSSKYAFPGRVPALAIVGSCRQLCCRTTTPLTYTHSCISHFWSEFSILPGRFFVLFGNCNDAK